ncbi:MAG TPA: hypothetical protein VJR05_09445, partial [Acidimicrobiia bacterium]|nr:hypothetical protein [Acidimicrobiia bacterium]
LAAGPAGALAAVSTSFFVDYSVLVPPEVLTPSSFVSRTPEGLAVFDYSHMESLERACASGNQGACTQLSNTAWEPNLRWSGTWEELGGEPAPDAFIEVYHAPPGGPFTEVETPFNTGYSLADLAAGADAFYAVGQIGGERFDRAAGVEVWRSVDGINWEESGGIPAVDRVVAMGALGDETVLVGVRDNPGQVVVASTTNGTEWEVIDLPGLLPAAAQGGGQWVNAAAMGPAGLIMHVTTWVRAGEAEREISQIVETADLENWSSTPAAGVVNGYVDQIIVGDVLFINATSGGVGGRVHTVGTRSG